MDFIYKNSNKLPPYLPFPLFLLEDERFYELSNDAKILYAIMLRRTDLSAKNGLVDCDGRVFIFCTVEEITKTLHCCRQTAVNALASIEKKGLIVKTRRGCGKPNQIYVKIPNAEV